MFRFSRTELLLFLTCFFAFSYFNQGGGWNQNSRFAEVRAMAEEGRFAIDDYFVFLRDPQVEELQRMKVDHAEYTFAGKRHRLCWVDAVWTLEPVGARPLEEGVEKVPMIEVCSSGDVAFVDRTGNFHPNKPPGTSLIALPSYFLIYRIERALGINPDHWWTMNVNAWLTTIFSVGLISALGCVCFFRLAREFSGGESGPALVATLALAFGTTFFPFGTILFDHNLTAMLLLVSFYWLRPRTARPALAGFCAGFAVVTNYIAGGAVVALGLYALLAGCPENAPRQWQWRRAILFSLGGLLPAVVLGGYHFINFGSPFALNNDFQNPLFKDPRGSLGMFVLPNAYVGALLLFSPYRGVFWLAPILILGVAGLVRWLRERTFVAEARLCIAIFGFFFLVNMSFNGYHGGFAAGPRYLIPGLPFLALPLVMAVVRWKRTALVLLVVSVAQQLLLTATDAQNALAVGGHARLDEEHRRDDFFCNIVTEYAWPLFVTGRAGGLLDRLLEARLDKDADRLIAAGKSETEVEDELAERRAEWRAAIDRGDKDPFLLAAIHGPVSVNPVGMYDGLLGFGAFEMNSVPAAWASFNVGEFLWPRSRWSLLPLLVIGGGLVFAMFTARRVESDG